MGLIPDRLGPKLGLFLVGLFVLLGVATAALVIVGFEQTQNEATSSSRRGLEEEGQERLRRLAEAQASFGQGQMETTAGFAQQAGKFLVATSGDPAAPPFDTTALATNAQGVVYDARSDRVTEVLLPPGTALTEDVLRDIEDSQALDDLLPVLLEGYTGFTRSPNFNAISIYYQSANNVARMYPRVPDVEAIQPLAEDLQRSTMSVGPEANPSRATVWSAPYDDTAGRGLVITALTPVYDGDVFIGAMGVDLSLAQLVAQVDAVRPTANGMAFYIDTRGELLPSGAAPLVRAEIGDERNARMAAIVESMRQGRASVDRVEIGGEEMFVAYVPFQGIGGTLALAAPVEEVTAQAAAVDEAITDGSRNTLLIALIGLTLVFVLALGAAAWLNRRLILQPIGELVDGTRAVAAGDYDVAIPVRTDDELGSLAASFNGMTDVLRERTAALHESEAELSALFRSMTDVVMRIDREGRYLSIAPTSQPEFVVPAQSIIGKRLHDTYPKEQADQMLEPVVRALDTGQPQSIEYRGRFGLGHRWYAAAISPMSENEVVVVSRDVTERKEQETALREREEQYRSTFEGTSDGIVITRIEDGRIMDANPAFCEMHGYTREEMLQLHPTQFIHADDHHLFVDYVDTVAAGGEYRCRARDVRKDGSMFHVEVLGAPVTFNGQRHILGVVRDVTAVVEAEQILERRVEERTAELAALLHVSQEVAAALDIKSVAAAILTELGEVAEYTGATLATVEGDDLVIIDSWGPFREEVVGGPTARFPRTAIPDEFWGVMERGEPVVIDDVRDDSLLARSYRKVFRPFLEMPSFQAIRSWIAVPMMRHGKVSGMLTASHDQPAHFRDENTRLIVAAGSQGAVAMENARLFEQTRERTKELTTLLEVSRRIASKLSFNELVDTILDQAGTLFDTTAVSISLVTADGRATHLGTNNERMRARGIEPGFEYSMAGWGPLWEAIRTDRAILIEDVRGESEYALAYQAAVGRELDGLFLEVRSWMGIPLTVKDHVIGMLIITHSQPAHYTESDLNLGRALANQAAVAMENARLFQETEERTRELKTLLQVSANVASTIEQQPLVEMILEQVRAVAPYYRAAFMMVQGEELVVLGVGMQPGEVDPLYMEQMGMRFPTKNARLWERVSEGQAVIIDDVRGDSQDARAFRGAVGDTFDTIFHGIRGWMAVPLMLQDRPLGMLALACDGVDFYTEQHARLVRAVADQAVMALENARLFEETEQRSRESGALLQVARSITSTIELQNLVRTILEQLGTVVDYTGSSVVIVNEDDQLEILSSRVLDPPNTPEARGVRFPLDHRSRTWRMLEEGRPVVVEDVRDEHSPLAREYRATIGEAMNADSFRKIRSWLAVPLGIKERTIGLLSMSRSEPNFFTPAHVRIASAIGQQAALAIENARLFEQEARRTGELATLLDLSRDLAATIEIQPLLDLILEQVRVVAPYDGATFFLLYGDRLRADAYVTLPDESMDLSTRGLEIPIAGAGLLWAQAAAGETTMIPDVRGEGPEAAAFRAVAGPLLESRWRRVRSWLGVPLVLGGRTIGVLALSGHEPGVFTQQHARLARAVADQAAIAIENARLYDETDRRARETEALLRADAELFRSLSLDDVFQALCDVAVDVLGVGKCMVTTIEDASGRYTVRASRNISRESLREMEAIRDRQPRAALATMTEAMVNVDARAAISEMSEVFERERIVSTMDVPIRIGGQVRGDFAIAFTERHDPTTNEMRLFQALADRASVAIQNAELYERAQQAASLEERQRLARELHDSVSQALYGIALGARTARTQLDRDPARAVEPVDYVLQLAEAGLAEMRALIFELRPESLQTEGLVAAIDKHVASTRARYSMDVHAELCGEPEARIEVKEALYRVAQEALHNIVKHAHAHHVDVKLEAVNGTVALEVRDDGRGFDTQGSYPGHVGLHSMRERVEKVRGSIDIESELGQGTVIRVRVPAGGAVSGT